MPRFRVGDEALWGEHEVTVEAREKRESGEYFYAIKKPDGSHHYVSEYKLRPWHNPDHPSEHTIEYYKRKNEAGLAYMKYRNKRIRSLLT